MIRTLVLSAALLACAGAQAVTTQLTTNAQDVGEISVTTSDTMGTPAPAYLPSCALDPYGEDFPCGRAIYRPGVALEDALSVTTDVTAFKAISWFQLDIQMLPVGEIPDFEVTFTATDLDTSATLFTVTFTEPWATGMDGRQFYRSQVFLDAPDVHHLSLSTTVTMLEPFVPGEMPIVDLYGVHVATIPEPGTYALMLAGLAAVGLRRRAHA